MQGLLSDEHVYLSFLPLAKADLAKKKMIVWLHACGLVHEELVV